MRRTSITPRYSCASGNPPSAWGQETKGAPISKAPVKWAQAIVPSVFSERGPCSDPVVPRRASRVTSSHPGCRRQWYQLRSEPHQSPIRIKASERASRRISSSPWHVVPQTTVGSRSCPPYARTGCRAASVLAPTPFWLTTEASQSPTPVARERTG